jgi:hypothetical protein
MPTILHLFPKRSAGKFPPELLDQLNELFVPNQAGRGVVGSDGGSAGMVNSYYYEQGVARSGPAC